MLLLGKQQSVVTGATPFSGTTPMTAHTGCSSGPERRSSRLDGNTRETNGSGLRDNLSLPKTQAGRVVRENPVAFPIALYLSPTVPQSLIPRFSRPAAFIRVSFTCSLATLQSQHLPRRAAGSASRSRSYWFPPVWLKTPNGWTKLCSHTSPIR